MERFLGQVGLVTGASEGIGYAIAQRLIHEGAHIVICGRRPDVLKAAADRLGDRCTPAVLDVEDSMGLAALIKKTHAQHGRFDLLVNNAMHVGWSPIAATELQAFQQDFRVNVDAAFVSTRAAMSLMQEQGQGAIVNVASINGLLAIDNMAAYSASKAALIHFSKCAAMEAAVANVRINVIAPGVISTGATVDALGGIPGYTEAVAGGVPMNRLGHPDEVASVACFLLSDEASYVTGVCLSIDGGKAAQLVVPPPPES
ncbi:MAG: glucose 1-dehydrogenase [Gammaproteobacteria bacterium]|nr:glucose 1-dehydrogenase [Gammaproteobacteria bacterium]